jgi:hypothetical protein
MILEGVNRYQICQELGIDCPTREKTFPNVAKARAWVISQNIKRRHLTTGQLAAWASDMATRKEGRATSQKELVELNLRKPTPAKEMGISPSSLKKAKIIKEKGILPGLPK